jgi:D-sedoheptulose 7-phosphate isomerase
VVDHLSPPLGIRDLVERQMHHRNAATVSFFQREAERLAQVCREMSDRFRRGGRLLAFGTGQSVTDAQHVAVEFVHPVLTGKRALPALDLSMAYGRWVPAVVRPEDIVIGFGPPQGDQQVAATLHDAMSCGALALALPGVTGHYAVNAPSTDPFVHQEIVEILYHTLWETVHVFFERHPVGYGAGAACFLYPFLGDRQQLTDDVVSDVAASIELKATCVMRLREQVASEQSDDIVTVAHALHDRFTRGGALLCFGNGGSATDATDLALDLVASPKGYRRVPAISLAMEPATLSAIANDIGTDAIFLRQIIAHGRPEDAVIALSTSGGSLNIVNGLVEARARGLLTIALLGYDGGEVRRRRLADHIIVVNSDQIPRIQEVQASIYHVMLDVLEAIRGGQ